MTTDYEWRDISHAVQVSITTTKDCGCHKRDDRWHLCPYHLGMQHGLMTLPDVWLTVSGDSGTVHALGPPEAVEALKALVAEHDRLKAQTRT